MWAYLDQDHNPFLTVAVFLTAYFLTLSVGRLLKRRSGVRFGILFQLFCLVLAFYAALSVYGLKADWRNHIGAALILLSSAVIVALLNRYLFDYYYEKRRGRVIPRLLRDTVGFILFLVALLLVLSVGYHAETQLKGLLAGSGIAAIIIGFAAQNLLSGVLAGMSLQIGPPYKLGDWLKLGDQFGEVVEITWGATKLRTNDGVSLEVPNNEIVKQTIINLHYPTPLHAMRIMVGADYNVPPNRVKDALMRAASQATGVMPEPPPKVYLKEYADSAINYEVKFWMMNHAQYNDICDAIRTNVWYEFKRRKINIPFPIRTLQVERRHLRSNEDALAPARAMLRKEALFSCLSDDQLEGMLRQAEVNHFGRGEAIIEEGAEGDSMFILLRGTAHVSVAKNDTLIRVGVLRQGDCFGEMSLLTGEPRTATVRAEKDCEVLEIGKAVISDLLHGAPQCLNQLSALLAHRKMETEGILKEATKPEERAEREREYTANFLKTLRSFFEI